MTETRAGVVRVEDPARVMPAEVWLHLTRDEAVALKELVAPHAGRGALRYVHNYVKSALEPPAYKWDVPEPLAAAANAVAALDNLWDHPNTFRAAQSELHRLEAALQKAGVTIRRNDGTTWRGSLLALLWTSGLHKHTDTHDWRLLLDTDPDGWHPTGPTLPDLVRHWRETNGTRLTRVQHRGCPPYYVPRAQDVADQECCPYCGTGVPVV